jgi:PDZ-binding kinase
VADPKAQYIGTEPWNPKEAMEEEGEITDKADIFAYGLTLWEMMTLAMPHVDMLDVDVDDEEEEDTGDDGESTNSTMGYQRKWSSAMMFKRREVNVYIGTAVSSGRVILSN